MPNTSSHAVTVQEVTEGARPIQTADVSVIGVVVTANDADPEAFPLNRPSLITDLDGALDKAGDTGTLAETLDAISDHGSPDTVVIRVQEDADEAQTISNMIGGYENGMYTGMKGLLAAKTKLKVTPRILGIPKYDTQPVTAELITIAKKIRGFVYASAHGANDIVDAANYRNHFGDRELMLLYPDFEAWNTTTNSADPRNAVARALGLRAKIDREVGWHGSLSNKAVQGVTGITKDLSWALQDTTDDISYLNKNEVTGVVNNLGYRFWGCRTCSSEPMYMFEAYTRTAHVLAETMAEAHAWAMAEPLTPMLAKDILEGITEKFRELVANGQLIGASAWIDPAKNSATQLYNGKLTLSYDYTPVPPLEHLELIQKITSDYLVNFSTAVTA